MSAFAPAVTANDLSEPLLGLDLIHPGSKVALAVSGGGDSIAMMHAVYRWAQYHNVELSVFTVDHRLRSESADEAKFVGRICKDLSLPHEILTWNTPKASQNSARLARHRLLANATRRIGAKYLLLGHTLDDATETQIMRLTRKPTPKKTIGPMPISVSPVWPEGRGILIMRPLQLLTRKLLRDWLRSNGLEWIDDPSNESDLYERPRIRKALQNDLSVRKDDTIRALQSRARAEAPLSRILDQCAGRCDAFGLIRLPVTIDRAVLTDLISILVPVAAGTDRIPKAYARLSAMSDMLDPKGSRYTIGGAWLQRAESDIMIGREPAKHEFATEEGVFDGRFIEDQACNLPENAAPFLVRHALPPSRSGWRSLIPDRLRTHSEALEANALLLTRPRVSNLS